MKNYNDLTDVEKFIIREFDSWKNSDLKNDFTDGCFEYRYTQLQYWYERAKISKIDHLL